MPTLCLIKSEFGFLRQVLYLRSRSLTKGLLQTSAGEDLRSCLTSVPTTLLFVSHPCVGFGGKLHTGCAVQTEAVSRIMPWWDYMVSEKAEVV